MKNSSHLQLVPAPATSDLPPEFLPIRRLRAEANFLKFPFFDLTRHASGAQRGSLEIREFLTNPDGTRLEILWHVERSFHSTFPGEFARRIHREVVERLVSELPRPIQNPIRLGSFSDICRLLQIRPSGKTIHEIREALDSIFKASVQSRSTFYSKVRKRYIEDNFHLYDRVLFAGDILPSGETAEAIYVILGSWYLENLNASYVIPLDFEYLRSLHGSIASRMYELLHHWFFVSLRSGQPLIQRRYSTLCAYFPLTRQDTLWKARKQLRDAHQQHHETTYLASPPDWQPVRGTSDDWTLTYVAGQRALDEYRRNQGRADRNGITSEEITSVSSNLIALPPAPELLLSEIQRDLARELELRGITHGIALALVKEHDAPRIQGQLEVFDWLMTRADRPVTRNPAGYLRTAIEQNHAPPAGFISREDRQRVSGEAAARQQTEQAAVAEKERQVQERSSHLDALWSSLDATNQARLHEQARAELNPFALRKLQEELRDGRQGIGHCTLQTQLHKLLEALELQQPSR